MFRLRQRRQFLEELVLAKIAAVDRIGGVVRVGEFLGVDDTDRKREPARNFQRLFQLAARQAGRIGNGGERAILEDVMRHVGQEHRVDAAGIGDEAGAVALQKAPQVLQLVIHVRHRSR